MWRHFFPAGSVCFGLTVWFGDCPRMQTTADMDGDGILTFAELQEVGATLLGHMTEYEFTAFWELLKPEGETDDTVTYLLRSNRSNILQLRHHSVCGKCGI